MKIINCGSLNIDHVYRVPHFVAPGETLATRDYQVFAGGKGNNQSVALARAGARVVHAGKIGTEATWLHERLAAEGVDTSLIMTSAQPTGHAVIQVNDEGENAIFLFGGANQDWKAGDVARVCEAIQRDDTVLLQNEINATAEVMEQAAKCGANIVFNPAPMTDEVRHYPLGLVGMFILNELEGQALTGKAEPFAIAQTLRAQFPQAAVVLTLGRGGARYVDAEAAHQCPAPVVDAIDTTAAGDTFIGYFLAQRISGSDVIGSLNSACRAAAFCVTRAGAVDAIPHATEVRGTGV